MDGKTEEVKHMEKVVTSDPGLLAEINEQARNRGDEPRAGFPVPQCGRSAVLSGHSPTSLQLLSVSHGMRIWLKVVKATAAGPRTRNNGRHRCLPCPPHGRFRVFAKALHISPRSEPFGLALHPGLPMKPPNGSPSLNLQTEIFHYTWEASWQKTAQFFPHSMRLNF